MSISKEIPNSKLEVDYLTVDTPIPGQNFVCISMISPENVIEQKEEFMMNEFWKSLKDSYETEDQYVVECLKKDDSYSLASEFRDFKQKNEEELTSKYNEKVKFQTSMRGIKIRGCYDTYDEAKHRCEYLQKVDSNHNVFIGSVGYWLPWDPTPNNIKDAVYQEEQLNELMKGYEENMAKKDIFYHKQKEERKAQIIAENEERKTAQQNPVVEEIFEEDNVKTYSEKN